MRFPGERHMMNNAGVGAFGAVAFCVFVLAVSVGLVITARTSAVWFRGIMEATHIPMPRSRATATKNMTPASVQIQGMGGSLIMSVVVYNVVAFSIRASAFSPDFRAWILLCAGIAGASGAVAVFSLIGGISQGLSASAAVQSRRRTVGGWVFILSLITLVIGSVLAGLR